MPGQIGSKSIEIKTTKFNQAAILCTGRHVNVIPVNLHPFLPVCYAWSNLTSRIGSKSIEIKTTKFKQAAILCTGRHTNVIPVNLHPFLPVFHAWSNLTDRSNLTGRIGSKSIEIKTTKFKQAAILCTGRHTNVIPVNLHPFLVVFHAQLNLTGHEILLKMGVNSLRLHCMPAWLNWV